MDRMSLIEESQEAVPGERMRGRGISYLKIEHIGTLDPFPLLFLLYASFT